MQQQFHHDSHENTVREEEDKLTDQGRDGQNRF